jgi:hypothetical protein
MRNEATKWLFGMCCAGFLAASSAHGTVLLTFDENGNSTTGFSSETYKSPGTDSQPGVSISGPSGSYTEPSGSGSATLDYLTPLEGEFGAKIGAFSEWGWLAVYYYGTPSSDYGTATGLASLIHFDSSGTGPSYTGPGGTSTTYDQLFYYSTEGTGNLADHMPLSSVETSVLAYPYLQSVTESATGLAYYTPPTSYSGGYTTGVSGATQYEYEFVSVVPEPTTMIAGALLLLPFGVSTLRIMRKPRLA